MIWLQQQLINSLPSILLRPQIPQLPLYIKCLKICTLPCDPSLGYLHVVNISLCHCIQTYIYLKVASEELNLKQHLNFPNC